MLGLLWNSSSLAQHESNLFAKYFFSQRIIDVGDFGTIFQCCDLQLDCTKYLCKGHQAHKRLIDEPCCVRQGKRKAIDKAATLVAAEAAKPKAKRGRPKNVTVTSASHTEVQDARSNTLTVNRDVAHASWVFVVLIPQLERVMVCMQ